MDSVCLISYTLRDTVENCGNPRACLQMEIKLKYDKNEMLRVPYILHTINIFSFSFVSLCPFVSSPKHNTNAFFDQGKLHYTVVTLVSK